MLAAFLRGDALLGGIELPLTRVLAAMERRGIAADLDFLHDLQKEFADGVAAAAAECYAVIGHEVNLGSPKQLQEVLFDQLGMPKTKKIKTGYTTDADALQNLIGTHPVIEALLLHREMTRLLMVVEKQLLPTVADDGRIHTTFNQTIAATGRLSSTEPNLQNIPIRTELGREIRACFVAEEGHQLISADYSQVELRVLAHIADEQVLRDIFLRGEDVGDRAGDRVLAGVLCGAGQEEGPRPGRQGRETGEKGAVQSARIATRTSAIPSDTEAPAQKRAARPMRTRAKGRKRSPAARISMPSAPKTRSARSTRTAGASRT